MKKILIAVVGLMVLTLGGGWLYVNVIADDAAPLTLDSRSGETDSTAGADDGTTDGVWRVSSQSLAGYLVPEELQGAGSITADGITNDIEGSITIAGTAVTEGEFTVQVASIKSQGQFARTQRDNQFTGNIMDTDEFPTAIFRLTEPIEFGEITKDKEITATATGELTMHGVTKAVTFPVKAKRATGEIAVNGFIDIHFADYNIENPSRGPASVGDDGQVQFTLVFVR